MITNMSIGEGVPLEYKDDCVIHMFIKETSPLPKELTTIFLIVNEVYIMTFGNDGLYNFDYNWRDVIALGRTR